jgi:hypothetical protein
MTRKAQVALQVELATLASVCDLSKYHLLAKPRLKCSLMSCRTGLTMPS